MYRDVKFLPEPPAKENGFKLEADDALFLLSSRSIPIFGDNQ
jgi:hypothetical protein